MPRTVYAEDSAAENFAGLLDQLTRLSSPASTRTELDSVRLSAAGLNASSPADRRERLAPVTEVKPRSGRLAAEAAPLSYEKALRLHSRRSLATDLEMPPAKASSPARAEQRPTEQSATEQSQNGRRKPDSAEPDRKPVSVARPQTQARTQIQTRTEAATVPQPAAQKPSGQKSARKQAPDVLSSGIRGGRAAAKRVVAQDAVKPAVPAPKVSLAHKTARYANTDSGAHARSRSRAATSARGSARKEAVAAGPSAPPDVKAQNIKTETFQLEVMPRATAINRRQEIVSIRLNEAEFDRLRERAAESGISVSAYMRSCVLDAEHLRTQVKQALAEMRASVAPREQALLSSGRPALANPGGGGAWSRLLWKSATFFLGPWFPFRHRA